MREIKFRAWNKVTRKMIDISTGINLDNSFLAVKYCGDSECELMQFTGLHKNGKEIYEGDILASRGNYITDEIDEHGNYPDFHGFVFWHKESASFRVKVPPDTAGWQVGPFKEIIGNIHESPELLEEHDSR